MNKRTDSTMIRCDLPLRLHPTFVRAAGRGGTVQNEIPHGEGSSRPLRVSEETLVRGLRGASVQQAHAVRLAELFKVLYSPVIDPRMRGEGTDQRLLFRHRHAYIGVNPNDDTTLVLQRKTLTKRQSSLIEIGIRISRIGQMGRSNTQTGVSSVILEASGLQGNDGRRVLQTTPGNSMPDGRMNDHSNGTPKGITNKHGMYVEVILTLCNA